MSPEKTVSHHHDEKHHLSGFFESAVITLGDIISSFGYAPGVGVTIMFIFGILRFRGLMGAFVSVIGGMIVVLFIQIIHRSRGSGGVSTMLARHKSLRIFTPFVANGVRIDYGVTGPVSLTSLALGVMSLWGLYGQEWKITVGIAVVMLAVMVWLGNRGTHESGNVMGLIVGSYLITVFILGILLVAADYYNVSPLVGSPKVEEALPKNPIVAVAFIFALVTLGSNFTGCEAISNFISRIRNYNMSVVLWAKKTFPNATILNTFEGNVGVGSLLQLLIGIFPVVGILLVLYYIPMFNAYNGVAGRESIVNLAVIAGTVLGSVAATVFSFWMALNNSAIQSAATMTALTDFGNTGYRDALAGILPLSLAKTNKKGGFYLLNAVYFVIGALIMFFSKASMVTLLVLYGQMVWMLITFGGVGLTVEAIAEKNVKYTRFGVFASIASGFIFLAQVIFKWAEGGWISFLLFVIVSTLSFAYFLSSAGHRDINAIQKILGEDSPFPENSRHEMIKYVIEMQELRRDVLAALSGLLARPQPYQRNLDMLAADPKKEHTPTQTN